MAEKYSNQVDVKKRSGIEFIFEFKDSITNLTHWYGMYVNLLAELQNKYSSNSESETSELLRKITDQEKQSIIQYCQEIRYNATICIIKYNSISTKLKFPVNKKIEQEYSKLKNKFIIDDDVLYLIVVELNNVLTNEIIQELLRSNYDLIKDIYSTNQNKDISNA